MGGSSPNLNIICAIRCEVAISATTTASATLCTASTNRSIQTSTLKSPERDGEVKERGLGLGQLTHKLLLTSERSQLLYANIFSFASS